jgi:hypothetical protein
MILGLALVPGGNATDLVLKVTEMGGERALCNATFQDYLVRCNP